MTRLYCDPTITVDDEARSARLKAMAQAERLDAERARDVAKGERRVRERIAAQRVRS